MHATRRLPESYFLTREVDLSKDPPLLIKLNVIGVGLFIAFFVLFSRLAMLLTSAAPRKALWAGGIEISLSTVVLVVLAFVVVLVLHEAVHGVFFWIFTRARPHFGLKAAYAYAAAPDWYISRNSYLIIGSAPLVVISLVGTALMPVIPTQLLLPWLFLLTTNASGAVGDLYIVGWLLTQPSATLIQDRGDGMAIYSLQPGQIAAQIETARGTQTVSPGDQDTQT